MPLINNTIFFSEDDKALIEEKRQLGTSSHLDWGANELMPIRSKIRNFYRTEQRGICAYCKSDVSLRSASNAHIEHIAPKSLYLSFMFEPKNLCVICADCNEIKRNQEVLNEVVDTFSGKVNRYPRSSSAFKIVHPLFDNYDEHILKKGRVYIDRSAKGAFTIGACKLNRYFHEFGVDDEFVNDEELVSQMNEYIGSQSTVQKAGILNRLRDMLFNL
ncbi:HNH endonuclease [Shewanella xiamenensis]|uniref:HNH endonuclease n=1 Tax=Shewanella xiamenensis TaxID=332186 RepID=UPI002E7C0A80|nr:HNH endonuclease [Shewanella xiamenensis]MEE1982781.1 HNH endonuclease [Shewanella xiamenensis]